ncbi:glycine betaine ABC transporter substrate-binding protein [Pseudomonas typographi]|uniref:Glycine betaine ABC transporter substrate-binding protein n=1 Tax=Pseudomonas typographi TaxID=2715964 RepID=A0ABR7Z9E9_9PSED|nr:glycine betaine ABC transporter substrate-binding protein [Pseudomonas typographi]MBD1601944.1 glycine betaine ABC transporter substrate-binding protein [Pseudomonas typographi]
MPAPSLYRPKAYAWLASLALTASSLLAHAAESAPVRIGWVNWSDTEITAKLAQTALQDHLKQPVQMIQADIGIQFQALANGNIDLIPMVWLPNTHKAFWDKYQSKLEDLGVLYEGRIGWAVPDIVPESEVASLEDLNKPEVKEKLGGRILTSEAGNDQYKLSLKAIDAYQLKGYKLVASSETGMLTEMERNLSRGQWSVINAWNPHWMFSKWKLRYLKEPKQIFGGAEQIHAVARKGFSQQYPQVAYFFAHYSLPLADLEQLMLKAKQSSSDAVVAEYYAANQPRFAAMFAAAAQAASAAQP